ncbi:sensor domain-containing diguanylate cyclase [Atlantibacter hermannii]|uniref:sensor domain-containing diguanylate cyclase n=1 Tax=Atlantibacter hermannii TaxID=565 RepID=UPI002897CEFD|nr:sensor domain-containing diguanylate cyclase [Atlantibacter hermannii]
MSDFILSRISETLASENSLEGLVRKLLETLEIVTEMDSTYLTKVEVEQGKQLILFSRNSKEMQIPEGMSVPWGDTLCKRAMDEGCLYTNDVAGRWGDSAAAKALGVRTYVSTPVQLDDGTLYGTLCAASSDKKDLSVRAEYVLRLFAGLIAQYVQKDSLLEQLREANAALIAHSYTDPLTNLPNRRAIFKNLDALFSIARHMKRTVIIAFIDLDDFKEINDLHGHETGDLFLIQVSERLSAGVSKDDIIGRLGGDEFLVAELGGAVDAPQEKNASRLKARLNGLLTGKYLLRDVALNYGGASIGIYVAQPAQEDPDSALRKADADMYIDKNARRQR